jgi:hypothetical protein
MSMTNARSDRLARYFGAIVHGGQNVNNASDFKRFLEAILDQNDHCKAVERLALSRNSMEALHHGLRFNITHTFINQYTAKFVQYLEDPKIKHLCNGLFFEQMLDVIMEPETLWNAFVVAFFSQQLDPHSVHALAWLISEVLALPTCSKADVMADAQRIVNDESISSSTSTDLRNLGHKIRYLLEMKTSASTMAVTGYSPGGRHDNDFPDFRKISILPTSDEFGCTVKPFYRRAEEVAELCGDQRVAGHLDNQFRLLREDMLCELREDFQTAIGAKKGRRSPINLGGLTLTRVSCGPESRRRIQPCALGVTCKSGLEPLLRPPQEKRKAFLMDNSQFLKHRAFGCLIRGTEIVAFATIERDIDELLRDVPVVLLRIGTEEATNKALLYLKLFADVKFLLVDAPIFAYEPILKCLQETGILPFKEELFLYEKSTPLTRSDLIPPTIINDLNGRANRDIRDILGASKAVKLDYSQLDSLVAGLTQRVSLIQGPPGMVSHSNVATHPLNQMIDI